MLDAYEANVTPEETERYEDWLGVLGHAVSEACNGE
jgi:hypothetical protein